MEVMPGILLTNNLLIRFLNPLHSSIYSRSDLQYRVFMLLEGGNIFYKEQRVYERGVGVSFRNGSSIAPAAKAREFAGPKTFTEPLIFLVCAAPTTP